MSQKGTRAKSRVRDMTVGSPLKHILVFAIPLLIGNLFQQIYSMVDTMVAGYNLGDDAIAAIGATSTLSSLFINIAVGQNNGFAIVVTQRFGAHDREGLKKAIAGMIELNIAIALILTVATVIFLRPLLHAMQVDTQIFEMSYQYMLFICIGLTATIAYNLFAGILRAFGNSLTSLIFLIVSSVLNILLDLLLIVVFHAGVAGAAIATMIAQAVSAVLSGIYCVRHYKEYLPGKEDIRLPWSVYSNLLSTGIGMALMYCVVDLGSVFFQGATNHLGKLYTTAYTAARRLISMLMIPCGTIATANSTFVGQNWGAGKTDRIQKTLLKSIGLEWIWAVFICTIIYIFGGNLVAFTTGTQDPEVIRYAVQSLRIHFPFYGPLGTLLVLRMAMQSMGNKITPVLSSSIELGLKLVAAFVLIPRYGFLITCCTEPTIWVSCMTFLTVIYFATRKKTYSRIKPVAE